MGRSASGSQATGPWSRRLRDRQRTYVPGSRAYASAGLPGADWWVAGPAVDRAGDAAVDLGEVDRFLTDLGV